MIPECTIVIPTYNRPDYLKRILSYYHKYGRNFEIIVADSSLSENKMLNSKNILSLSNKNLLHLKYPTDIDPLCEKIPDASKYIKTKYCVSCADDDFITPSAIKKSISFLENNPDFSCVQGRYIAFYLKGNCLSAKKFIYAPSHTNYESNIFKNAKDRLFSHLVNYMHTVYSVHRTDLFKMIFNEASKYADDVNFGELLPSMLDLIYGKMKKLDILFCAREATFDPTRRTGETLNDFIKNGTFEKKYNKFRDCLVEHLTKNSHISVDEAKALIDEAMSIYLKKHSKSFRGILTGKMRHLLNVLDLPEDVDKNIQKLYRKIFTPKYVINRLKEIDDFKNTIKSQDSKYFDDFERIQKHVLLYSKNNNENIVARVPD